MSRICFVAAAVSVGVIVAGARVGLAQDYPSKPIRILTTTAGGGNDVATRQIAQAISGPLGQPVIVENRTSFLATEAASKAPPDGYTLLVNGGSTWLTPLLQKAPFDVARDFSPISLLLREVNVFVVHPSVPAKSIKELIALAKAKPGQLNYSSASIGGASHLGAELFKSMADVNIVHVPYKGNAATITALISGEVQLGIIDAGVAAMHSKSGKLRALAVTSAMPSVLAPELPAVAAGGLPGYELVGSAGMWAPVKTPMAIIDRLNQEIVRFLRQPDVKERFLKTSVEVVGSSPEEFAAFIKSDMARMGKVIKDAGIKAD